MDQHTVMRNFHSSFRSMVMEDIKDPEMIEKLWGMNYLSGLSLDTQTVEIPSTLLFPLKPRDICSDAASLPNAPYSEQSPSSSCPDPQTEQDKDV